MEKQNLDNLQHITEGYSGAAWWLSNLILGIICVLTGIMMYFKIINSFVMFLIIMFSFFTFPFISRYLNRVVMRKGLGYVIQKGETTSLKQGIPREQILPAIIILCLIIIMSLILIWNSRIAWAIIFLGTGFYAMIFGLTNRKKVFFYNSFYVFYVGLYFIILGIVWILPIMKNILYANRDIASEIILIFMGFGMIFFSIINYFRYKNIIQRVRKINQN
ncbi:MAG: hypothetical protein WC614_09180 [bacterium]